MSKITSNFVLKKRAETAKKALKLYNEGLTLRQIGDLVGKSYEWVRGAINELSTPVQRKSVDTNDKEV